MGLELDVHLAHRRRRRRASRPDPGAYDAAQRRVAKRTAPELADAGVPHFTTLAAVSPYAHHRGDEGQHRRAVRARSSRPCAPRTPSIACASDRLAAIAADTPVACAGDRHERGEEEVRWAVYRLVSGSRSPRWLRRLSSAGGCGHDARRLPAVVRDAQTADCMFRCGR